MDREAVPDLGSHLAAEDIRQRFAAVNIQIVHYQMNGLGLWVFQCQGRGNQSKLKAGTIRCGEGEMPACFRLYGTENIGSTTALVLHTRPNTPTRPVTGDSA